MKKLSHTAGVLFVLILFLGAFCVCSAQDGNASDAFRSDIEKLQEANRLPYLNWQYHQIPDYQTEYANRFRYKYDTLMENVKNFVVKATISWETDSKNPEWNFTGCGFFFRMNYNEGIVPSEYLQAGIFADGFTHMFGYKSSIPLSYSKNYFSRYGATGTHDIVLTVDEDKMTMTVDNRIVMKRSNLALRKAGDFGFVTNSGSNDGYGTRCTWKNIEMYTWE